MSKVFIGIIVVMGLATYLLWNENSKLSALNQAFELRDQEQKAAIESLQNDFAKQTEGLLSADDKFLIAFSGRYLSPVSEDFFPDFVFQFCFPHALRDLCDFANAIMTYILHLLSCKT